MLRFSTCVAAFALLCGADVRSEEYKRVIDCDTQQHGHYSLIGTLSTIEKCEAACKSHDACPIYSYNTDSHHCYISKETFWKGDHNPRVTSACLPSKVPGCGACGGSPPPPPPSPPQPLVPQLVHVAGGTFLQGYSKLPIPASLGQPAFPKGDSDERPYRKTTVSSFQMSKTEITNAQYEQFDPSHKALRGKLGFSTGDDEAVVFVSWYDAVNYTHWLSAKENRSYRLPTEAEWEYAARGNVSQDHYFWTGDDVPQKMQNHQVDTGIPTQGLPLGVARFDANPFGIHDTIGNVEEWCHDWHANYSASPSTDPTGPTGGSFKVTRGGSHSTSLYYLRTSNRASALPTERSWYIGFRVVADGASVQQDSDHHEEHPPSHVPGYLAPPESWPSWSSQPMSPVVKKYVRIPGTGNESLPFAIHNHEPTLITCPNNDVVASWFSTNCGEPGRCTGLVTARLKKGAREWPIASVDFDVKDRCQCCTAMYFDTSSGVLYHFNAMSAAGTYQDIIGTLRWSTDCGVNWTKPKIIWADHGIEHQIVVTILKNKNGQVLVPCDHWGVPPYQYMGDQSVIQHADIAHVADPAAWTRKSPSTGNYTNTGSHHTSIVELRNGSYIAVGRGHDIDGTMALSYSLDGAHSWVPHKSSFPGIHGGQREVMIRLGSIDQPIMHCTYANDPMPVPDSAGGNFTVTGLYCAVSEDEGESFPKRRTITDDFTRAGHQQEGFDGKMFKMSYNTGEPNGYMAATVSQDGTIHLITSRNHYAFNLAWLSAAADPPPRD